MWEITSHVGCVTHRGMVLDEEFRGPSFVQCLQYQYCLLFNTNTTNKVSFLQKPVKACCMKFCRFYFS